MFHSGWLIRIKHRDKTVLEVIANFDRYFNEDLLSESLNESENSLNVLRVKKYTNNSRLKQLARDNMPFMGLDIHGLEEIKLDPNMPHTSSMKQKGIRIKVSSLNRVKTKGFIIRRFFFLSRPSRTCRQSGSTTTAVPRTRTPPA